jgi:hypothetical protein
MRQEALDSVPEERSHREWARVTVAIAGEEPPGPTTTRAPHRCKWTYSRSSPPTQTVSGELRRRVLSLACHICTRRRTTPISHLWSGCRLVGSRLVVVWDGATSLILTGPVCASMRCWLAVYGDQNSKSCRFCICSGSSVRIHSTACATGGPAI